MNNQTNIEKLQPTGIFTNYIFKAIPLAFDESMSYYETLCGLLDYLKNTVIPTVNNNADAIIEYEEKFNELQTFVDTYFDNLDVQQEVNNKLDEMVEDGTLDSLLNTNLTGSLSDLNTTDKDNLVSAINEVNGKTSDNETNIGLLSNLDTTYKSNLVGAINEIISNVEDIDDKFNYSTTEHRVGKWIDNSPVYRKVINLGDLTDSTRYNQYNELTVSTDITDYIKPVKITLIGGDGGYWNNLTNILDPDNNGHMSWINVTLVTNNVGESPSNNLVISPLGDITTPLYEKQAYAILEYIKFTPEE